jgi:predicted alpha-1,2-mannosidase
MKKIIIFITIIFFLILNSCGKQRSFTAFVDPFIGTGGHGHTYPGATLPFGMVQLSPDTRLTGWDGCSGYHYSDPVIYGFSHTHLSGTGISDYGDILIMPFTGKLTMERGNAYDTSSGYCSGFSHKKEIAQPGYYSVYLRDYKIHAELTVTPRTGVHRYTFPKTENARIIIDLTHRDPLIDASLKIVNDHEIEGFRRSQQWAQDQHIYFVAQFSKTFSDSGIKDHKAHVRFQTHEGEQIVVKVGISAVSIEGARKNLEAEAQWRSFDKIKSEAKLLWNDSLKKIAVDGGTVTQKRIFYTALYHALLNPNLYMDVDGNYRGRDLKIHRAEDYTYYTVFSLWDTFRTLHPLLTLIEPQRSNDFIKTFLAQYKQGGLLPVWELAANETFCMIGYHSVSVIADAFIKGLRDYDTELAFEAVSHSAHQDEGGLKNYKKRGYASGDKVAESVSKTLEYAYDDWCIAQMAKAMGKWGEYSYYIQRAQNYKNLFDPYSGFFRARIKGAWFKPFDPAEVNVHYTEANAWQYSLFVPQDITGLIDYLGGKEKLVQRLDALFSADSRTTGRQQADITGLIGQYAHGNEPSHHMAYLYSYANQPWNTQKRVRQIVDTLYTDQPDGLCGNEDCGQMSAWFIMSAIGFYPVTPGQDLYVIGTPLFKKTTIDVANDKTFTVLAPNVSKKNIYIQSATLNGNPFTRSWLKHSEIISGGTLEFTMASEPNKNWGSSDNDIPQSQINDHLILPVPYIASGSATFKETTEVTLASVVPDARIYFTLDNSTPIASSAVYQKPLILNKSTTIKAIAIKEGMPISQVLVAPFHKIPGDRKIKLLTAYASQYSAGGDMALVDGLKGGDDFRTGTWQGYHSVNLEAIITLNKMETINQINVGFIQDINSWIFMPPKVDYYLSSDGKTFTLVATVKNDISPKQGGSIKKEFRATFKSRSAQYIKVIAHNIGVCPSWHKGAGGKAWIFSDEITIAN